MQNKNRKNIIAQMFDVRPVDQDGIFDLEKIRSAEKIIKIVPRGNLNKTEERFGEIFSDIKHPDVFTDEVRRFQKIVAAEKKQIQTKIPIVVAADSGIQINTKMIEPRIARPRFVPDEVRVELRPIRAVMPPISRPTEKIVQQAPAINRSIKTNFSRPSYFDEIQKTYAAPPPKDRWFRKLRQEFSALREKVAEKHAFVQQGRRKFAFSFATVAVVIFCVIFGTGFAKKGLQVKGLVLGNGQGAYVDLVQAKEEIMQKNFESSEMKFNDAYDRFDKISQDLNSLGGALIEASRFVPYASRLSTGAALAQAGKDASRIGVLAGKIMQSMDSVKNPLDNSQIETGQADSVSLLKIFQDTTQNAKEIQTLLLDAQENIDKINVDDLPAAQRAQFVTIKNQLPEVNKFLTAIIGNSHIFTDVLGGNGPRKYLFLFQNNQEMRATGGFIGTYGVLDIFNGRINKFFIDGIFNPDGQLREKVVPPEPIQKISAAWSLHDSNWFPNFPVSAEKATWFYEKTGGPTVDGVITMTPAVMQKLLAVTGPIDLPDYGVTVDKDNFVEKVQQEVEVDYDKELNQPKKILADLAPKILDRIFNARSFSDIARTLNILNESLNEKQILIYSKNFEIEKELSNLGWSGEVLNTQKDYLSVINTNINGFKTDGMIEEKIEHQAEIQADGSVIDTVTVTRHHKGGNEAYEFWNKVNADYMRVYVPKGSQLLSTEGQTREFVTPPLDYGALNFKRDAQVQMEKEAMKIDEASGTTIYDDGEKTVFANWVYVSPQETVTVKYKYVLPFKVDLSRKNNPVDTYSLLAQKQSGSVGSQFISQIKYPDEFKINWKYPDGATTNGNNLKLETDLRTDKFVGVAFTK
ncbi:MAG: DUF4012 domain-containing protein [Parcubacteria group bacterium]|jgi:hypothetical protein